MKANEAINCAVREKAGCNEEVAVVHENVHCLRLLLVQLKLGWGWIDQEQLKLV